MHLKHNKMLMEYSRHSTNDKLWMLRCTSLLMLLVCFPGSVSLSYRRRYLCHTTLPRRDDTRFPPASESTQFLRAVSFLDTQSGVALLSRYRRRPTGFPRPPVLVCIILKPVWFIVGCRKVTSRVGVEDVNMPVKGSGKQPDVTGAS
ncbi:unnamed protein product [Arctogadus glacialis]